MHPTHHAHTAAPAVTPALDDLLALHGRLTLSASLYVALRVADAVRALHAQGRTCGGLPISRVRCHRNGEVELAKGRFPSAAPELRRGDAPDPLSDVWEVGGLLYRLLTGRDAKGDFEAPSALNPAVDTSLDELVMQCLARDPGLRPHAAEVLLRRLRAVFDELDLEPSPVELARFAGEVKAAAPKAAAAPQRRSPPAALRRDWEEGFATDDDDDDAADEDGEIFRRHDSDPKADRRWALASAVFAVVMLALAL